METVDLKDELSPLGLEQEAEVARICWEQWQNHTECDVDERCAFWRQQNRGIVEQLEP